MKVNGYTADEILKILHKQGIMMSRANVVRAMTNARNGVRGNAPTLEILMPTGKLRLATKESVERWVRWYIGRAKERQAVADGKIKPKDCIFLSIHTARRLKTRSTETPSQ